MFDGYNSMWVGILALEGSTSTKVQTGITLSSRNLFTIVYTVAAGREDGRAGRHFAVGGI